MARKPKPKPSKDLHIRVCESCGEPFETADEDRTVCPICPPHSLPHADPGWRDDDDPAFSNVVRNLEDRDQ